MSADRCGVGGRAFVEGGANFAYVPRIQEVAKPNLDEAKRSRVAAVVRWSKPLFFSNNQHFKIFSCKFIIP